jgi:NAD(P)H-flavin reductase
MENAEAHKIGLTVCVSREPPKDEMKHGRVTEILPARDFDFDLTQFYICGNPSMIVDSVDLLLKRGAKNIFREDY